jgi:hypothetical protein
MLNDLSYRTWSYDRIWLTQDTVYLRALVEWGTKLACSITYREFLDQLFLLKKDTVS